jgi:subtilase family serine protease
VPDVAMIASPDAPGAIVVLDFDGQAQIGCCIGGTSLSAPVFAGVAKLLEQKLGAF